MNVSSFRDLYWSPGSPYTTSALLTVLSPNVQATEGLDILHFCKISHIDALEYYLGQQNSAHLLAAFFLV